MIKIYLVRHGETDWNKSDRYQGFSDIPLNESGLAQAAECAEALKDIHFDKAICSDLVRAHVTAKTILKGREVPLHVTDGLREWNFGEWEGKTYEEICIHHKDIMHRVMENPSGVRVPGGEMMEDLQNRAIKAVEEAVSTMEDGQTLLVVCHGGTIRSLICKFIDVPLSSAMRFRQGNTAINLVNYFPENCCWNSLQFLNDVSHTSSQLETD